MRLAIGDVYKVKGYGPGFGETLDFTFEICGEAFFNGERFAIGLKQHYPPSDNQVVIFNNEGFAEIHDGDFKWQAWETSRAWPCFQRLGRAPDREPNE